jgi:hypothetical protein
VAAYTTTPIAKTNTNNAEDSLARSSDIITALAVINKINANKLLTRNRFIIIKIRNFKIVSLIYF